MGEIKKLTLREYIELRRDLVKAINRETGEILREGYSTDEDDDRRVVNTILEVLEEKKIIGKA